MNKKDKLQRELGNFVQKYGRKKQKGQDPNDRVYDRKLEQKIKKINPEELDEIINGEIIE